MSADGGTLALEPSLEALLVRRGVAAATVALASNGIFTMCEFTRANLKTCGISVGLRARLKLAQAEACTSFSASSQPINIRDAVFSYAYASRVTSSSTVHSASDSDAYQSSMAVLDICRSLRGGGRYACSLTDYRNGLGKLPFFPPPLAFVESDKLPSAHPLPFLTTAAGTGPLAGVPSNLPDYVMRYLTYGGTDARDTTRKLPHVQIDEITQPCYESSTEAARSITRAAAEGRRLWMLSMLPEMPHPPWWPWHARSIPSYEHLIVGIGSTGVGMHRDRFVDNEAAAAVAPSCERLMCTYISLAMGIKHVLLLPPTPQGAALAEEIGGVGCDEPAGRRVSARQPFPAQPSPALLERVVTSGGYWFDLGARDIDHHAVADGQGAMCLFLPAGWWHWLQADSEWHVAWSASFFPDADREHLADRRARSGMK